MKKYEKMMLRNIKYETRSEESGKKYVKGLIPYNSRSLDLGGFREQLAPTAFNKTLADKAEVRALFNHDTSKILGSTRSGTLQLQSTDEGLVCEVEMPNTTYANDLYEIMSRGDVSTMSFGFYDIKHTDEGQLRTLNEVKLEEVSFGVAMPAYPDTASAAYLRSYLMRRDAGMDLDVINGIFEKYSKDEKSLTEEDKNILKKFIETISAIVEVEPPAEKDPAEEADPKEEAVDDTNDKEADALALELEI